MCLPTNTEQLSAGGAAEQKAVTYRENIQGVRIQLVGGSHRSHWQLPHFLALPIPAHSALQSVLVNSESAAWQDFEVSAGRKRATETRNWGHDKASSPARTYNDWVGLSDFNRPTFSNHRRALES